MSFVNSTGLQAKHEKLPEGSTRTEALALADRLDLLAKELDIATDATLNAYAADVARYSTTTDQLVDDFEPLDQARAKVYRELVAVRQTLIDTLSPVEWYQVFG